MNSPSLLGTGQDRRPVSVRLSATARTILTRLSEERGISQASVLELLLRQTEGEDQKASRSFPLP